MTTKKVQKDSGDTVDIVIPESMRLDFIRASEAEDEKSIVISLMAGREIAPKPVYKFTMGGKEVTGLSIYGIRRLFEKVHKAPPDFHECVLTNRPHTEKGVPDGAVVHCAAVRGKLPQGNSAAWGVVEQPEYMHRRDGTWTWDQHAVAKVVSKAERNSQIKLVPVQMAAKYLAECLREKGQVKQLTQEDARQPTGERTARWVALNRRLYAIASAAFDVSTEENRAKLSEYVKKTMDKGISEMGEEELMVAGGVLNDLFKKLGKDKFTEVIMGVANG